MSCFRIGNNNFVDADIASNIEYSSEQVAFPGSNSENKKRRARVWRTGGFFNVTSSNNTIIFEETASTNLTATIAVAEYTSLSSFLTAVKNAFEAAGASTYTVTQDATTLKIKISSDGAGGGGILNIEWSNASTTAESLLGFDSVDDTGALEYTADFIRINSEEFVVVDMGLPTNPDMFALIGRRNLPIALSSSGTYKLQASPTDAWSSPALDITLTYDDEAFFRVESTIGQGLGSGTAYRFWRISFSDIDNPNGYLEVSKIFIGDTIGQSFTGKGQFPLVSQLVDRTTTITVEGGGTFSNVKQKSQNFSVNYFNLKKADVENLEDMFDEFGTGVPLFISLDEDAVISSSANKRLLYAKFTQPPQWSLVSPDVFSMTLNFQEEV